MSEHLSTAQLQQYGARAVPPREASRIIAHLDACPACFAALRELFPAMANPAPEVDWSVLLGADEPFHLDFEEHLQPFVDGETDETANEIVTSHIAVCPPCGQALRDLQEFRDSLRWQQAAQAAPGPWSRLSAWWQTGAWAGKSWAWVFGLLLACGVGAWFVLRRQTTPSVEIARTPATVATPALLATPPATPAPSLGREKPTPGPTPKPFAPDEPPPGAPAEVAQAIRSQKLSFPVILQGLGLLATPSGGRRGGNSEGPPSPAKAPQPQAPLGVTRETRPLLRWAGANGGPYQITVTDEQNNVVAASPQLTQTTWRPAQALPPGRLRWQVEAVEPNGQRVPGPAAAIYRLSPAEEAKLRSVEQATTSALARGVAYAQAGLLAEAAQSLRQWLKQHPDSQAAQNLLKQIESRR
jgi:hypothetical protein